MDPTAALAHIREHAEAAHAAEKAGDTEGEFLELSQLAEHFEGLDGWLTKGGFLPEQWRADNGTVKLVGHIGERGELVDLTTLTLGPDGKVANSYWTPVYRVSVG